MSGCAPSRPEWLEASWALAGIVSAHIAGVRRDGKFLAGSGEPNALARVEQCRTHVVRAGRGGKLPKGPDETTVMAPGSGETELTPAGSAEVEPTLPGSSEAEFASPGSVKMGNLSLMARAIYGLHLLIPVIGYP